MVETKALAINEDKSIHEIDYPTALERFRKGTEVTWIHIFDEDPHESAQMLLNDFGFHPVGVEDAVGRDERPELKEFEDHVFLVAPAIVGQEGEEEVYDEVGFFVKGQTLVTISHNKIPCLLGLIKRWTTRMSLSRPEVGYLVFALLDTILDDYFPRLDAIEDLVDCVSDMIYEGDTHKMRELLAIKRRMLYMRRRLGPFRDVMNSLLRRELDFVTEPMAPYYHDLFDNVLRLTELVDTNRDALTGLLDIHLSTVSNNLNEVMKKMTVISTVLMTSALIAGVYGMNFKIPEIGWEFGYLYSIILMVVSSLFVLWLFRRKGWL
ncbi:MAG: magnesium/cobalt transporter CorA [Armatimonadetes bacterium]|nr:magnesium/cobalt transporter CorA [Armatimonadota bacterium]